MMSLCKVLGFSVDVEGVEYGISEEVGKRDKGQDPSLSKNLLQGEGVFLMVWRLVFTLMCRNWPKTHNTTKTMIDFT